MQAMSLVQHSVKFATQGHEADAKCKLLVVVSHACNMCTQSIYENTQVDQMHMIMQINTAKQLATAQVCAYPWMPGLTKMIEAEAVRRGHPPMQTILEDASCDDLQHAANWADAVRYLEGITSNDVGRHVPLPQAVLHS